MTKKEYKPFGLLHLYVNPFTCPSKMWQMHLNLAGAYRKDMSDARSPNGSAIVLATTFPLDATKEEILYYAERIVIALTGANIKNQVPEDYEEWKDEAEGLRVLQKEHKL